MMFVAFMLGVIVLLSAAVIWPASYFLGALIAIGGSVCVIGSIAISILQYKAGRALQDYNRTRYDRFL